MGEVYSATDTRLDRTVAIKILPEHLANDPQRRERFEREAKAVSSLNHPHICTLYDVGEQDGIHFLVMELVEGESLRKRLEKGRLPLDQALEYAIQIANALDNAHRQGVVHRDLKPGNIMITKSAGVKLLDFGLARLGVRPPVTPLSQLNTEHDSEPLTAEGTILGTLRYMAPEQLEGKEADRRSDIFAFGVVVYEMVTGKRAFEGTSQAGLIAAIMHNNPRPMAELRADSPRMLDRIVGTCLAKSADDRWQSATDLELQIGWITEAAAVSAPPTPTVLARWRILPWALAVAGLSTAGVTLIDREPPIALRPSVRLTIDLPPEAPLAPAGSFFLGVGRPSLAMSPDGSLLVYVAIVDGERQLYLRNMRTGDFAPIQGTGDAQGPFFSPDSKWVGFFAENKLKTVRIDGGEPEEIANAIWGHGADWGDDHIYFAATEGLPISRVSPAGGPVEAETIWNGEWPSLLPGSTALLVTLRNLIGTSVGVATIGADRPANPMLSGSSARYVPTGHLAYGADGRLLVIPFDPVSMGVTGDSTVLIDDIRTEQHGAVQASWSDDGTLVYAPGPDLSKGEVIWLDREGNREPLGLPPGNFTKFELSPDGRLLALPIRDGATRDIWIYEIGRTGPQRLTFSGADAYGVWDREGESVFFWSLRPEGTGIYRIVVGGANQVPREVIPPSLGVGPPFQETEDGLLFGGGGNVDLLIADAIADPPASASSIRSVLRAPFAENFPELSPNGRWLSYMSDESGHWQIYVVSYPDQETKKLVSSTGGEEPRWNPDGSEIIYRYGSQWFSASFSDDPSLEVGSPVVLFEGPFINIPGYSWDISPDGDRFLLVENPAQNEPLTKLVVITNFFDEIQRRLPVDQ